MEPFNWDMDLMKMELLFKHHCTTKVKIKSPLQFKSKRRMEGRKFWVETPQEGRVNASSEDALMQKLLKIVEA